MRRNPIVENKHNAQELPDWPLLVQARETVHNLRGYKNKFMTNKPKDSIQVKNDDSVKLLFLQTLDFINVFHSLRNFASLLIYDLVEIIVII